MIKEKRKCKNCGYYKPNKQFNKEKNKVEEIPYCTYIFNTEPIGKLKVTNACDYYEEKIILGRIDFEAFCWFLGICTCVGAIISLLFNKWEALGVCSGLSVLCAYLHYKSTKKRKKKRIKNAK